MIPRLALPAAVLLAAGPALAHVGAHPADGLAAGLAHPFAGLDHLLAMAAVGLWATQRGGRALWLMPLTFLLALAVGGVLGMVLPGLPVPAGQALEVALALSVVALGVVVAAGGQLATPLALGLAGLFGAWHGLAHGQELPGGAGAAAYAAGFLTASAVLHAGGLALGLAAWRLSVPAAARLAGSAVGAAGLMMLAA